MNDVSFSDICAFTRKELWDIPGGLKEETALAHDLRIGGLDGKDFMERYAVTFHVDLSNFDWVEYFGPEASDPLGIFPYLYMRFVRGIPARDLITEPEITLRHLVICANSGRWAAPRKSV